MLSNYTARDRNVSADDCDDWMFVWMKCHAAKRSSSGNAVMKESTTLIKFTNTLN